jgi:hypothetical protein
MLECAAQVGDFVGGIATLAGLFLALFTVNRWRRERRDERRGDAATSRIPRRCAVGSLR